jgi:hypothetical protein
MSSIAHFIDRVEVHGQVLIGPEGPSGARTVYFGEPSCCAPVFSMKLGRSKKLYSNPITGERLGTLRHVLAIAGERGPGCLAVVKAQIAAHQARRAA